MSYFIDTHTHIYLKSFEKDREQAIQKCIDANVSKLYMPAIDTQTIEDLLETQSQYPEYCYAMLGLHPCSVEKGFEKELYTLESLFKREKDKFIAIGEIGTDMYWDKTLLELQKEALKIQIEWAKQSALPISIHCRDSFADSAEVLETYKDETLRGVFHCFGGTMEEAKRAIDLGFYLGIGGIVTFKNSGLDKLLPNIDLKHIVLETDSPYLAPVPYRGKRNESAYIPIIAQRIAEIKGVTVEEIMNITTENALKLFSKATKPVEIQ